MSMELLTKSSVNKGYGDKLTRLPLSVIQSNPFVLRKPPSEGTVEELAESIQQIGLLHPILIKESEDHYEIISGERRFRAYQLLEDRYPGKFSKIPSILIDSRLDTRVFSLTENIQREPLTILEECEAVYSLIETVKDTYGGIGKTLGKSEDYIENRMRYLRIHKALKSRINPYPVSSSFYERFDQLSLAKVLSLKPLLSHWSEEECHQLLVEITEGDLSLREIKRRLCDHQEKRMERRSLPSPQQSSKPLQMEKKELSSLTKSLSPQTNGIVSDKGLITDKDFWSTFLKLIREKLQLEIADPGSFQKALQALIHQHGRPLKS